MDVAALVVSLVALAAGLLSAIATQRQAGAARNAVRAAAKANEVAEAALRVAEEGTAIERDRRYAEQRPVFEFVVTGPQTGGTVSGVLRSNSPVTYDAIELRVHERSADLLAGFVDAPADEPTSQLGRAEPLPPGGEWPVLLKRRDGQPGGRGVIVVEAVRDGDRWQTNVSLQLAPPPRVVTRGSRRIIMPGT